MTTHQIAEKRRVPHVEHGRPALTAVRFRVTDLEQDARTLIRQRPVAAVLAAAGIGYFVARLVSRAVR